MRTSFVCLFFCQEEIILISLLLYDHYRYSCYFNIKTLYLHSNSQALLTLKYSKGIFLLNYFFIYVALNENHIKDHTLNQKRRSKQNFSIVSLHSHSSNTVLLIADQMESNRLLTRSKITVSWFSNI